MSLLSLCKHSYSWCPVVWLCIFLELSLQIKILEVELLGCSFYFRWVLPACSRALNSTGGDKALCEQRWCPHGKSWNIQGTKASCRFGDAMLQDSSPQEQCESLGPPRCVTQFGWITAHMLKWRKCLASENLSFRGQVSPPLRINAGFKRCLNVFF